MAEFLIQMQINIPPDMPAAELDELRRREKERGLELRAEGTIQRVWRVPGRVANIGYWHAADATELHDKIASLPMFPWMDVQVTPLARHYLEAEG